MDPFSLTVGVFGLVTAVTSCIKGIKKHVGPSSRSSAETESLKKSLCEFLGAMTSFQAHLGLNDDDDERMASLEQLKPVITQSLESLEIVQHFIDSGRTKQILRGIKFDKKIKIALKSLDDASELFKMAILLDQR